MNLAAGMATAESFCAMDRHRRLYRANMATKMTAPPSNIYRRFSLSPSEGERAGEGGVLYRDALIYSAFLR